MVLSQSVSFLWNAQQASPTASRENLKQPLVIKNIVDWVLIDNLNELMELKILVNKANSDLNQIYCERDVFVPGFNFEGIITGLTDIDDDLLEITIKELGWHFTRRQYKIEDSFKEYTISLVSPASLPILLDGILDSANLDMPIINEKTISNLQHFWRLNGNTTDDKGSEDGTWTGAAVYDTGYYNGTQFALFDGTAKHIAISDAPFDFEITDSFSLSCMFKINDFTNTQFMFGKQNAAAAQGYQTQISNATTQIRFRISADNINKIVVESDFVFKLNTWYHYTVTYDGSGTGAGVHMYINGIETSTHFNADDYVSGSTLVADELLLGRQNITSTNYFDGVLGECRVYDKVITPSEASLLAAATQSDIDLIRQLMLWKLGSGETTISDLVSLINFDDQVLDQKASNNGTIIGGAPYVPGKYGKAIMLDGSTQWVTLANETNFDRENTLAQSWSVWVRTNNVPSSAKIIASKKLNNNVAGWNIRFNTDGKISLEFEGTAGTSARVKSTTTSINDNAWHLVTITYSGNQLAFGIKIYIDGVLETMSTQQDDMSGSSLNNELVTIGSHPAGVDAFTGEIDDFRIYNKELTANEVSLLANAQFSYIDNIRTDVIPPTSDLNFNVNWKHYYDLFKQIAKETLNDIWFEKTIVWLGKKGKTIIPEKTDKIYQKLRSKISLDNYGNITNLVGAKVGGTNVVATEDNSANSNLTYKYERTASNNNLTSQTSVDNVIGRVADDFDSINPDVRIDISDDIVKKYDLKSGDVIKIIANTETQTNKGFYRVIKLKLSQKKNTAIFQFSENGKFIPRLSDNLDILNAALIKLKELEINS